MQQFNKILTTLIIAVFTSITSAGEILIGEIEKNGMEIIAVYLQPVTMQPMLSGMKGDIHLEADIHAIKGNKNGFGAGDWIPYLDVAFHITKKGSNFSITGNFEAMVASDGPHYGQNIKLDGPGKYHLIYNIKPPSYNGMFRHTDTETGVNKWWDPMYFEWDFSYAGIGKKGGY